MVVCPFIDSLILELYNGQPRVIRPSSKFSDVYVLNDLHTKHRCKSWRFDILQSSSQSDQEILAVVMLCP